MRVVIAVGGKSLLDPAQGVVPGGLKAGIRAAAAAVAEIARRHEVVVTHGGSPQVGFFAYRSALAQGTAEDTLDLAGAEAEGYLGYLLQQALENELREREVITVLTQVEVDPDAPGFARQHKLVGPVIAPVDAERLARERGWTFEPVGRGSRRAVPSPEPLAVVELRTIERLTAEGVLVICGGGGGIPVLCDADGTLSGVEAVIDKDRTAALMATLLGADLLLYLTDVPAVAAEWGSAFVRPVEQATPAQLRLQRLDEATMGIKVESACRFVEQTGKRAAIGALSEAAAVCAGRAGTQILAYDLLEAAKLSVAPGGAAP
jgi:carbamate kinase